MKIITVKVWYDHQDTWGGSESMMVSADKRYWLELNLPVRSNNGRNWMKRGLRDHY